MLKKNKKQEQIKKLQSKIKEIEDKPEDRKLSLASTLVCYVSSIALCATLGYMVPDGETNKIISAVIAGDVGGLTLGTLAHFAYFSRPISKKLDEMRICILENKIKKLSREEGKAYKKLTLPILSEEVYDIEK